MKSRFELVIFDMDGTLVEQKSSWGWLHQYFGSLSGESRLLKLYTEGKISYEEFMTGDIQSWPRPLHITEVAYALSACKLRTEARQTIRQIKRRGIRVAMITAGIDLLAERTAESLEIDNFLCNSLEVDPEGYLTGRGIKRVEPKLKDKAARELSTKIGIGLDRSIGVADHEYDKSFLRSVGLGLVFHNRDLADETGLPIISDLKEVLRYFA